MANTDQDVEFALQSINKRRREGNWPVPRIWQEARNFGFDGDARQKFMNQVAEVVNADLVEPRIVNTRARIDHQSWVGSIEKAKLGVAMDQIRALFRSLPAAVLRNGEEVNKGIDACVEAANRLHSTVYATGMEDAQVTTDLQSQIARQHRQGPDWDRRPNTPAQYSSTGGTPAQYGVTMVTSARTSSTVGTPTQQGLRRQIKPAQQVATAAESTLKEQQNQAIVVKSRGPMKPKGETSPPPSSVVKSGAGEQERVVHEVVMLEEKEDPLADAFNFSESEGEMQAD
jgi:hypothetical protein